MNTEQIVSPKSSATTLRLNAQILGATADMLLLSSDAVFAKCKELNIPVTGDKLKMIDKIIIDTFGLDACKKAFARRS
jgi:hypothetical protein